ncbi:LysR family transcriptional regulator [Adlercreutzia sp. ZJ473]|uniref:LysR family transcriptional regulator n=1 Tax=Adlercreutzia sp. ZJ473 TaxID=2722822 RepID=UPI0015543183
MDIDKLRCLKILEKKRSIALAAEEANYSVQGFAKVMASLEKELGCELIVKTRGDVNFTKGGDVVLTYTDTILGAWKQMRDELQELRSDSTALKNYPIKLLVSPLCKLAIIDPLCESLSLNIEQIYEIDTKKALGDLPFVGPDWIVLLDFPSALMSIDELQPSYEVVSVKADRMILVKSRTMDLEVPLSQHLSPIPKKMMQSLPLGIYEDETIHSALETVFPRFTLHNVISRSGNLNDLFESMASGNLCLMVPEMAWNSFLAKRSVDPRSFNRIPLEDDFDATYAFVSKRGNSADSLHASIIEALAREAALL